MADISQGSHADIVLSPSDVFRVSTGGTATVVSNYGAPAGTTTLTAQAQDFGPYLVPAKLQVNAVSGGLSYALVAPPAFTSAEIVAGKALVSSDGIAGYLSKFTRQLDAGFGAVTYAQASANLMVIDNTGKLQTCLSGEAAFHGARRSGNLIAFSETFTDNGVTWQLGGGTANTTLAASPYRNPVNNRFATRLTRLAGDGNNMLTLRSKNYRPGAHSFSIWLRGVDGSQSYILTLTRTPSTAVDTVTVTPPAGVWTRYALEGDVIDTTNHFVVIKPSSVGGADQLIDVACAMMKEGVTDEYVPRGVGAIPAVYWAGEANVDGVRYFDTANPWSVASHVATRTVAEALIDPTRLIGLRQGPEVVNRFYSSRDIGAAQWTAGTASTAVAAASIADDSITLGYRGMRKLTEADTTSAAHFVYQDWKSSNPPTTEIITAQCFVKAGERTVAYIRIRQLDGSTNAIAFFNLSTGVIGNVSGTRAEAHIFKPHPLSDVWLIALSYPAGSSGSTAPRAEFGISNAMGTSSYAGTATNGAYFGGMLFTTAQAPVAYTGDTSSAGTLTRAIATIDLAPVNHPRIGFTWEVEQTLWWRSSIETKTAYAYVMYAYQDAANRYGVNMRAGVNGGGWSGAEDDVTSDIFDGTLAGAGLLDEAGGAITPGTDLWDGTDIRGYAWQPMETIKWQFSVGAASLTGQTNQAMNVGGQQSVPTADSRDWSVKTLSFAPSAAVPITLGRNRVGGVPRGGDSYFRNARWTAAARTQDQQAAAA